MPQKLTQKDLVKCKYKVSVVISPVIATMAKHAEVHLWIHTLDVIIRLSYYQFSHQEYFIAVHIWLSFVYLFALSQFCNSASVLSTNGK